MSIFNLKVLTTMYTTIRYSTLLLAMALLFGCSNEFLDKDPQFAISSGTFWRTAQDARLALSGCYDALQAPWLYAQRNQNEASLKERECFTDNSMNGFLYQRYNNIKNGTFTPADEIPTLRPWRSLYQAIGRANELIANAPNIEELSAQEIDELIGQAKAIRALSYWNLTNTFDDVPLVIEPLAVSDAQVGASEELEVYAQIVTDLEDAISVLPNEWTGDDYGKITAQGARALLARVHLFFYGYRGVSDGAQRAAALTGEIINSGQFGLFPDFENLFRPENEDSEEVIWSVRFTADLGGNNGEGFSHSFNAQAQATNQPLPNFVNSFHCIDGLPITESPLYNPDSFWLRRDPRWDATIIYSGEKWLENAPPYNPNPGNRRTGFGLEKYVIENNVGIPPTNGGQDWYIIRYADVLLMRAEALLETGNTGQEVYDLINQVRQRVNMPTIEEVEGTGLSYDQLTEILRHERRVELAFENTRFYDLKRWGTMREAYERSASDRKLDRAMGNPIIANVSFQGDRSLILPIPQAELDANINLVQHPAWQ